ncbi:MAG TPA: hypothetical protein VJU61_27535 [Polyangiaceae bacterium]|nr:hypothetical protein [Polyangiaceae bacterium]
MTTSRALKRILARRVDSIEWASIAVRGPFKVEVAIKPCAGASFDEAKKATYEALGRDGVAGVLYEVVEYIDQENQTSERAPRAHLRLAAFASDQTMSGLRRTLVNAVPALGRAVIEEVPGKEVRLRVAYANGHSSPALVAEVQAALSAVGFAGLPFRVSELPSHHPRNDLQNAGFPLPRREESIVKITEEDEDTYATQIQRLVKGETDDVPLVDAHEGTRLLVTPSFHRPVPLACLLALYDRVFVEMPTGKAGEHDRYFEQNFDVGQADFIAYVRKSRVIPIFKFNLGVYTRELTQLWLDDPGLPMLTPRQFDYVAMRHVWTSSPHLRLLRADKASSSAIADLVRRALSTPGYPAQSRSVVQNLDWMILGAEEFEGLAWHRGHLALANLSSGALFGHVLAGIPHLFPNKGVADTAVLDAFGIAKDIATAQAFGASLTEGMLVNGALLNMILPFYSEAGEVLSAERTTATAQIVKSLELHHSPRVPANEYLDVLDKAETRRIREITRQLLDDGHDEPKWLELREKVRALNEEVGKIERNAVDKSDVDVVGDLAKAGQLTLGMKMVAELLQLSTVRRAGAMLFERAVDDTSLGDALDKVRGAINGVSPQAIRVFRVRRKLGS